MLNIKHNPPFQGLLIGATAALITLLLHVGGTLDWLEAKTWDWRVRWLASPALATDRVCTIIIDQNSLDDAEDLLGLTWKWPREIYGAILSFCKRGGARAVAFDMIYTERSDIDIGDDIRFGEAIADGPPCVAALPLSTTLADGKRKVTWPQNAKQRFVDADRMLAPLPALMPQLTMQDASFPVPQVTTNVALLGSVHAVPDTDALFRRAPIGHVFDGRFVPTLGLAAYLAAEPEAALGTTRSGLRVNAMRIPLDKKGLAILRFRGPTQTHLALNATAVLQSELRLREGGSPTVDPQILKDRYVFFGVTAPGLMDLKPTPLGRTYPGVEVHATFLDNLLSGDFARELPSAGVLALMIAFGLGAGIAGRCCRNGRQTVLAFVAFLAIPPVAGLAAYPARLWLPVAPLEVVAGLALLCAVIVNYALEGRQKRFIKGAFKQYLSPVVIDKLVQNPDRLQLGGEEKTLTLLFSDIQGFTSISEGLNPTALTTLLNTYLTAMTDVIHEEGGTIDKYEGDAIIAFWNAPLEQPDHAARAVRAALRCQSVLAEMRPTLREQCGKDIYVRIGINTGPVVVGNMGSNQRFDYTFLGDAGNLAARLEGINKQFDTYLMISEFTREAMGDAFPTRELSRVQVVGRSQPVTVHEPFLPEIFAARETELKAFAAALQLYYAGDFGKACDAFGALAERDPTAGIYANRCRVLTATPMDEWQGIWTMTEK